MFFYLITLIGVLYIVVLVFGISLILLKRKKWNRYYLDNKLKIVNTKETHQEKNLSCNFTLKVLVTFCTENEKIIPLLNSIIHSNVPANGVVDFILVGDSPNEITLNIVERWNKQWPDKFSYILTPQKMGKSSAIIWALKKIGLDNQKILTLDADVFFSPECIPYIILLANNEYNFIQFPVISWINDETPLKMAQFIESIGVIFFNSLFFITRMPIIGQGAAMLWKVSPALLNILKSKKSQWGDDMYIAYYFYKQNKNKFHYSLASNNVFYTHPVSTIKEYLIQRSRWLKKITLKEFPFHFFMALFVYFVNLILVLSILITPLLSIVIILAEFLVFFAISHITKIKVHLLFIFKFIYSRFIHAILSLILIIQLYDFIGKNGKKCGFRFSKN